MKQKQAKLLYSPPKAEIWVIEQKPWSILSSSSVTLDVVDYDETGIATEDWGEGSDV